MSAKYSLWVVMVVGALLMINSFWLSKTKQQLCPDCETSSHVVAPIDSPVISSAAYPVKSQANSQVNSQASP